MEREFASFSRVLGLSRGRGQRKTFYNIDVRGLWDGSLVGSKYSCIGVANGKLVIVKGRK